MYPPWDELNDFLIESFCRHLGFPLNAKMRRKRWFTVWHLPSSASSKVFVNIWEQPLSKTFNHKYMAWIHRIHGTYGYICPHEWLIFMGSMHARMTFQHPLFFVTFRYIPSWARHVELFPSKLPNAWLEIRDFWGALWTHTTVLDNLMLVQDVSAMRINKLQISRSAY